MAINGEAVSLRAALQLPPTEMDSMFAELRVYYAKHGIAALDFRCPHFTACSADSPGFTTAQETYVGPNYGVGRLPRLLFLSLDSGSHDAKDPADRTMEGVRRRVLAKNLDELNRGRHWYLTHLMAVAIFREFDPTIRDIERARSCFAHANAAKCCQNKDHREKADKRLFENCRPYIPGEVRILRPDILITQGDEARSAIMGQFRAVTALRAELCQSQIVLLDSTHRMLWLHTYHPNSWGNFRKQQRECWPKYVAAAVAFMRETA